MSSKQKKDEQIPPWSLRWAVPLHFDFLMPVSLHSFSIDPGVSILSAEAIPSLVYA